MPRGCGQAVEKLCKSLCKSVGLFTSSTAAIKYLTSQVFFVRSLYTWFEQVVWAYGQVVLSIFKVISGDLSPLCTLPMNTTKLIKE